MTEERINEINNMTIEQLNEEVKEVYGTIQNEKISMYGSDDKESERQHSTNVFNLREELRYIYYTIEANKTVAEESKLDE